MRKYNSTTKTTGPYQQQRNSKQPSTLQ